VIPTEPRTSREKPKVIVRLYAGFDYDNPSDPDVPARVLHWDFFRDSGCAIWANILIGRKEPR
jgi:hypothetical protein